MLLHNSSIEVWRMIFVRSDDDDDVRFQMHKPPSNLAMVDANLEWSAKRFQWIERRVTTSSRIHNVWKSTDVVVVVKKHNFLAFPCKNRRSPSAQWVSNPDQSSSFKFCSSYYWSPWKTLNSTKWIVRWHWWITRNANVNVAKPKINAAVREK